MKKYLVAGLAIGVSVCAMPAVAGVVISAGSGSAVTTVDATADFESTDALNSAVYTENGLSFTRTNLSYNNNGCGYGACSLLNSGNAMYGVGTDGYFDIMAEAGKTFSGLEFAVANGFGIAPMNVVFEAFLNGVSVGSGQLTVNWDSVVGFSGGDFDTLRYTDLDAGTYKAPAFDSVRAQYSTSDVPEPASWAMMVGGFGLMGAAMRRKKTAVSFA